MKAEEEEVECCGPRGEEGPPPPVIVLTTELKIAEEDGGLCTCDQKDNEGYEDEPKHVVCLM